MSHCDQFDQKHVLGKAMCWGIRDMLGYKGFQTLGPFSGAIVEHTCRASISERL